MIRYLTKLMTPQAPLPDRFAAAREAQRRRLIADKRAAETDDDPLERTVELPLPGEWPY